MGLIFFTYFFAVVLLWNFVYLSFRQSNYINVLLNKITLPAAAVSCCIAVSVHLDFYEQIKLQRIVSTAGFFFILLASHHILNMSFFLAEIKLHKILQKCSMALHIAGVALIVFFYR